MSHLIDSWEDSLSIFSPNVFAISHYVSHQVVPSHCSKTQFWPKKLKPYSKGQYFDSFWDENSNQNFDFLKNELEFCFSNNLLVEQCVLCDKDTYFRNFERVSRECHKVYDWEISEMQGEAIFNWMQFLTLWNSLAQSGPNHLHCMYHSFLYSQRKFSQDCHGIFFFHCDSCHR